MLRKVLAHLSIIFAGMCFVLFVVDKIKGGAMSFINNDITKAFIAILSLLAIVESVVTLSAQTREQKLLRMVQAYRQKFGPLPQPREAGVRPAQPAPSSTRRPAQSRPASGNRPVAPRPAQPRAVSARPAQARPAQNRPASNAPAARPAPNATPYRRAGGNPPQRSRYNTAGAQGGSSLRQR